MAPKKKTVVSAKPKPKAVVTKKVTPRKPKPVINRVMVAKKVQTGEGWKRSILKRKQVKKA